MPAWVSPNTVGWTNWLVPSGGTAVQQFRSLAQRIVDMPGDFADRCRIDQRADGHALFQSVADLELAHFLHQPCSEAVINAVLHQ
ncbi:hypothetical protein PSYPI_36300, partial [Pseudomonas syringae pv. pisi str. 1704B]